jgi:hypothetical protein
MKIIIEAPAGSARERQVGKMLATVLPRSATMMFDPRDQRKCREPSGPDWMICADPEFGKLPDEVRCAADRVYRLEGLDNWRMLQYCT